MQEIDAYGRQNSDGARTCTDRSGGVQSHRTLRALVGRFSRSPDSCAYCCGFEAKVEQYLSGAEAHAKHSDWTGVFAAARQPSRGAVEVAATRRPGQPGLGEDSADGDGTDTHDDQDECLRVCRIFRIADPGIYKVFTNQCTSHVRSCLQICGVHDSRYGGPDPKKLFDELETVTQPRGKDE